MPPLMDLDLRLRTAKSGFDYYRGRIKSLKVSDYAMAEKIILPAWVESVSEPIEFPDIAELLTYPFFFKVSAEDLRKEGTDFHRKLLDHTPLNNNTKYISIYSNVQFLHPNVDPNLRKLRGTYDNEWHTDRDPGNNFNSTWHIIMNNCTARTEFNMNEIEVDEEDYYDKNYLNIVKHFNTKYIDKIIGKKCEPFRVHTFGSHHLHRSTMAEKPEFRFFFRVMETDFLPPFPVDTAKYYSSTVQDLNGRTIESISQTKHGVKINFNWQ